VDVCGSCKSLLALDFIG